MREGFEYILADTRKLIAQLRQDNPEMLDHAEYKFSGDTAEGWLECNSRSNAPEMGHWTWGLGHGLDMSSGHAALIKLVQEIDLPCFPITVEKSIGEAALRELQEKIGYSYKGANIYSFVQPKHRGEDTLDRQILPSSRVQGPSG